MNERSEASLVTTGKQSDASRTTSIDEIREVGLRRIEETDVAGPGTGHMREDNLFAIQRFVDNDPHCAWNFPNPTDYAFDDVLAMISGLTGCSSDPGHRVGDGYISPNKTLEGLEAAAARIADVARAGGTFMLATGHPGSMLSFYQRICDLIQELGGRIVCPARGADVPPKYHLDYVGSVGVITDYASLPHTHDYRQMEAALADAGSLDMVVGDHGYAGVAIEAGIPTVTVMDTNDPALAVWKHNGADVTIIPIDDNESLSAYLPHAETIRAFATLNRNGLR